MTGPEWQGEAFSVPLPASSVVSAMSDRLLDKVLGCVIGAAIGDTIGAVVEFLDRDRVREQLGGKEWVDGMYEFGPWYIHPLGVFSESPPKGTGTDDTRLNHIFLECVAKNAGRVNRQLLAMEYVERYRNVAAYYPKTPDVARTHIGFSFARCCRELGMADVPQYGDGFVSTYFNDLNGIPGLAGLLHLQSVGLLCPGRPDDAYRRAVELNFFDIGYANDATAILAATVAAALSEGQPSGRELVEIGIGTNPFGIGGADGRGRRMVGGDPRTPQRPSILTLLEAVDGAADDREAMAALSRACRDLHPYDPLDVLGVPLAVIHHTDGDPVRSVLMAANHRDLDEDGNLIRMRDVDCVAMVAGVIVGALHGVDEWPDEWVAAAVAANKEVYGFDIERNARDFHAAITGA